MAGPRCIVERSQGEPLVIGELLVDALDVCRIAIHDCSPFGLRVVEKCLQRVHSLPAPPPRQRGERALKVRLNVLRVRRQDEGGVREVVVPAGRVVDRLARPNCGPSPILRCADLHVYRLPRVIDSTCGTSVMTTDTSKTWGVCQSD